MAYDYNELALEILDIYQSFGRKVTDREVRERMTVSPVTYNKAKVHLREHAEEIAGLAYVADHAGWCFTDNPLIAGQMLHSNLAEGKVRLQRMMKSTSNPLRHFDEASSRRIERLMENLVEEYDYAQTQVNRRLLASVLEG